ncbi:MAG: hypothetical protein ACM3SW_03510 [Actinomycetota bacterium]
MPVRLMPLNIGGTRTAITSRREQNRTPANDFSTVLVGPWVDWKLPTLTGKRNSSKTSKTSTGTIFRDLSNLNISTWHSLPYILLR